MKKTAQDYFDAVSAFDSKIYDSMGIVHQFTIDMSEHAYEELSSAAARESTNNLESILGSISYKCDCALEVMDKNLPDYAAIEELKTIVKYND